MTSKEAHMEKESKFSVQIFSSEEELYDRTAERYKETVVPEINLEEFFSIYGSLKESIYTANRNLYALDLIMEKKFKAYMHTKQFDQARASLDKCAEYLQKATEKSRRMSFYLKHMIENYTDNQEAHDKR